MSRPDRKQRFSINLCEHRSRIGLALLACLFSIILGQWSERISAQNQGPDVDVRFTADNAYGFGYGNNNEMNNYFGGIESRLARDIFSCNPSVGVEEYVVPSVSVDDVLYVVAWSDKAVTQGVIGHFKSGGQTIYTGMGAWEVYATGINYSPISPRPGPSLIEINDQIDIANAAAGDAHTTSITWVDQGGSGGSGRLQFGEVNDDSAGRGGFPSHVLPRSECALDVV